jgi:hypothetical protein
MQFVRLAIGGVLRRARDLYRHLKEDATPYLGAKGNFLDEISSSETRPLIRWAKGDGKDDIVTRSAIAQATRLFGDSVDYCIAINNISVARARKVIEWSAQPVQILVQSPALNPELARFLQEAACPPWKYGYWWKWFPARVRPNAPELILDGDMVVVRKPDWFDDWRNGRDVIRVSQDDRWDFDLYGQYADLVDPEMRLYSGLISIPPQLDFMKSMIRVLSTKPLKKGHDGRIDKSEQGCVAAAFRDFHVEPIPLHEFPFARAFEEKLDYGLMGPQGPPWGYHFGTSFRLKNPHFFELAKAGEIFWREDQPRL